MESRSPLPRTGHPGPRRRWPPLWHLQLTPAGVRTPDQFEAAFASIGGAQALYVVEDPIFFAHRATLLKLAANARLPTVHELRRFPEQGALMSYGPDSMTSFVALLCMLTEFSRAVSQLSYLSSNQPSSNS